MPPKPESPPSLSITPVGVVRSPFRERADAPRQPSLARDVAATVELFAGCGYEDALSDLERWDHIWLIFWFDRNGLAFRPKVRPPRSAQKRGVFATRSPYRPNPIGMSAVRLERVAGLTLHIRGVDLLDQTPILDIKPYVSYTDAIVDANRGWLDAEVDAPARYEVRFSALAEAQLAFLSEEGATLRARLEGALSTGPAPHAYRRIRRDGDSYRLAAKDWRAWFTVERSTVCVTHLGSGYRPRELLASGSAPALHRAFAARFGGASAS